MLNRRRFKLIMFAALLALLTLCCVWYLHWEKSACTSPGLITPAELEGLEPARFADPGMIYYRGVPAPADINNETLFIPCSAESFSSPEELLAGLSCLDPGCSLYLLADEAASDIAAAIAQSRTLSLVICRGGSYQTMPLMLSTLPVLDLKSLSSHPGETEDRPVYGGSYDLFAADSDQLWSGAVEWHVRGASSAIFAKKPWKLDLKRLGGRSGAADFLGLGQSSDWILNPLIYDDSKVREKTVQDLWNSCVYPLHHDCRMSVGEYVELFVDGDYRGLYLLQRRVDEEYLGIDPERDLLFRGYYNFELSLEENYALLHSPYSPARSYELLAQALNSENGHGIDTDSFITVNNLVNLIGGIDNYSYHNTFYILRYTEEGYRLIHYLWDTDLVLGINIDENSNAYPSYEDTIHSILLREDLSLLPMAEEEIHRLLQENWQQQRQDIYSEERMLAIADANRALLEASGSLIRDEQRWGFLYSGRDSYELVRQYISDRPAVLDEYYSSLFN